jgi:hypothetical protein
MTKSLFVSKFCIDLQVQNTVISTQKIFPCVFKPHSRVKFGENGENYPREYAIFMSHVITKCLLNTMAKSTKLTYNYRGSSKVQHLVRGKNKVGWPCQAISTPVVLKCCVTS